MKLWWVKGKKLTESGYFGKNLMLEKMLKNILKIGFFGFCKKLVQLCAEFLDLNHAP